MTMKQELTLCGLASSKQHEVNNDESALGTKADTNNNICLLNSSIS